jgi:hypothetical protein
MIGVDVEPYHITEEKGGWRIEGKHFILYTQALTINNELRTMIEVQIQQGRRESRALLHFPPHHEIGGVRNSWDGGTRNPFPNREQKCTFGDFQLPDVFWAAWNFGSVLRNRGLGSTKPNSTNVQRRVRLSSRDDPVSIIYII